MVSGNQARRLAGQGPRVGFAELFLEKLHQETWHKADSAYKYLYATSKQLAFEEQHVPDQSLEVDCVGLVPRMLKLDNGMCRGMVNSAFEFAEICRDHDYHNFLFSMKASNPLVMVQAYRLLAAEQYRLGWDYPLHLGYLPPLPLHHTTGQSAVHAGWVYIHTGYPPFPHLYVTTRCWLQSSMG